MDLGLCKWSVLLFERSRYSEQDSEFEKYIRNKYYRNPGAASQNEFTSPIRVMVTIVIALGFVDYFFVK